MPEVSISFLSKHTGHTRDTIVRRLDKMPFVAEGDHQGAAKMYDSVAALRLIYNGSDEPGETGRIPTQAEASRDLNIAKKAQIELTMESARKERIPLEDLNEINEEVYLQVVALLKTHAGKTLSDELLNDIFTAAREIARKVKERGSNE